MGASANPSGNPDGANGGPLRPGGAGGVSDEGGAGSSVPGNPSNGATPGPAQALKHNPGLSIEWSAEEQTILEEGLSKYASGSIIVRYAKIAMELRYKTVRDVALRCRWLSKKENSKRRKEDHNLTRKSKDKKVCYHRGKARTARCIPVRQLTGTRTGRYRAVPLRSAVGGQFPSSMVDLRRIDHRRSIEEEKGKKKKKKKRRRRSTSRR
ncbi:hypothetical protein B296_00020513 [Ensete ventricosum]|uniref:Myb-like domain-containing protein n=1 Tax=Ensete ventricosum TaxID=4639 RepID=A0A427AZQ5_ENSVE|nr:hypothetical protein B296_00020513 [Ensete ventricosum]